MQFLYRRRFEKMIGQLFSENLERRDKVQIFADIIKGTTRPTKTTRILRLANVQYNTFQECIDKLCRAGLLEKILISKNPSTSDKRTKYAIKATDLGLKWCEKVDDIYQILEEI